MKKFTVILILALLLTVALTLTACDELCNHDIVIDEAVPATCTEGGFTEGKHCSRCFKGFVAQEKTPALGHTEVIDQAVPSTCTTTGLTEGKHCATCGEILVKQQVVEMHNVVAGQARPATCTTTGLTAGKYCNVCGETIEAQQVIDALGHTEEILPAVPATCTTTGLTEGKHCTVCDVNTVKQQVTPITHQEINHEAKEPTCTEIGWDAYTTCSRCDHSTYNEIAATGHSFDGDGACTKCDFVPYLTYELAENESEYILVYADPIVSGDIVIPSTYNGKPVTAIGENAFYNCINLSGITIPNSVTSIGDYAFQCCKNLTNVVLSGRLTSISHGTFKECISLTKITIPDSVKGIGNYAFLGCDNLSKVIFGENSHLTKIWRSAFNGCINLTDIELPDTLIEISGSAFLGCDSLTKIVIPDSVSVIEWSAFMGCDNLSQVVFGENSQLSTIGDYAFQNCSSLTSFAIPEGVTEINEYCFYDCKNLTSIIIPDSVTRIWHSNAFGNCTSLSDVYYCGTEEQWEELTSEIATSVVFGNATIHFNYVPSSVRCSGMWGNLAWVLNTKTGKLVISGTGEMKDFSSNTLQAWNSINNYTAKTVIIEEGVTSIGGYAFYFDRLESITIPNSVTTIRDSAFFGCYSLTSITIPNSVTTIGDFVFQYCYDLTSIVVEEGNPVYHSEGNCLIETATKTLIAGCQNSVIPADGSVTSIKDYAFTRCENLTSIIIPNAITNIGNGAFYWCSELASITLSNDVTYIGESAFSNCSNLTDVYFMGTEEDWNAIVIESGNDVLSTATIHFIEIRDAVAPTCTETGLTEGKYCSTCDKVLVAQEVVDTLEHDIVNHKAKAPTCTQIGWDAYEACSRCDYSTYNEIPATGHDIDENDVCIHGDYAAGVTYIPLKNGMEYELVGVNKNVSGDFVVPSKFNGKPVTAIANNAFLGCVNLTSIKIEEGYYNLTIGSSAFANCVRLKTIEIPSNVTKINNNAFHNCPSLTDIYYYGSEDRWDDIYKELVFPSLGSDLDNVKIHFIITLDAVAPTCTKTGLTEGKYCETCQKTVVAQESIDALGHDYDKDGNCLVCEDPEARYELTEDSTGYILEYIANKNLAGTYVMENTYKNKPITVIGDSAFGMCAQLESVVISDSVTTIEEMAFVGCTNLTSVVIPKSVTIIGIGAFALCDNLTDIYFTGTEAEWNALTGKGSLAGTSNATIHFNYVPEQN